MKFLMLIFSLVTMVCCSSAFAALTQAQAKKAEYELNSSSPNAQAANQLGSPVISQKKAVAKANWKFSRDGGAVSTITLKTPDGNPIRLPKGAIVSDCLLDFRTTAQSSGSATLSFGTGQSTTDLKSALAVASATGLVACVPVGTAATAIKLTADRAPSLVIGTAALTAGEVNVLMEYWLSD